MVIIVGYVKDGIRKERVIATPVKSFTKKAKHKEMMEVAEQYVTRSSIQYVMEADDSQFAGEEA